MNNKGFIRTVEAFLSATIMIVAISFMMSEEKISYTGAPASETVQGENYLYDVLAVMENSEIHGEGKLSYYIANREPYNLKRDIDTYITKEYTYEMHIYKIESIVVDTSSIAVDYDGNGILTNGYTVSSDMNNNDIWHYYEDHLFDLPFSINMLVVDHDSEPGYDTIYLNLEGDDDYTNMATWDYDFGPGKYYWNLLSYRELEVGDTFVIKKEVTNEYTINYKYIVNSISPDGNSAAFCLSEADMAIYDDLSPPGLGYEIDIFDWTVRFSYVDSSLTVELNDNGNYRILAQGLRKGDFVEVNSYSGYIGLLESDYLSIKFRGYKQQIMELRRGGKVYTAVSARRIINVREGDDLNIYYVYLIRGRGEVE